MNVIILPASPSEAERLLDIYAPYVRDTTVTFEYEIPTLAEFRRRMERVCAVYPWLVAKREENGEILGYAYADLPFSTRRAYAWNADLSVYLDPSVKGQGIGRALYGALIALLERLGYRNVYGLITGENADSLAFHRKMGFSVAGIMHASGFKFGRWMDVIWVEKAIGGAGRPESLPMKMGDLPSGEVRQILATFKATPLGSRLTP